MATERAKDEKGGIERRAALELRPGFLIGAKYRLLRPAGFGGMGAVWVARNNATAAEVAIKVLLVDEATSDEAAARFRREAYAAANLSHRGIVRVFDLVELDGEMAGVLVLVMELLHGRTLAELLERRTAEGHEALEVVEAVEIALALLSALAHAHAQGIVHRDVKPSNVFLSVDPDGHTEPKLLDFGISMVRTPDAPRITGDGALLGTPAYMSPEQARGNTDVDPRSDVFSLGIVLYEMLSGVNPFAVGSYHTVVAAILEREPEPIAAIPPALWEVVATALQKKPDSRFASADDFAGALRTAAGPLAHPRPQTSFPSVPMMRVSSEPLPLTSAARRALPTLMDDDRVERRRRRTRVLAVLFGVALALMAAAFFLRPVVFAPAPAPPLPVVIDHPASAPATSRALSEPPASAEAPVRARAEALPMAPPVAPQVNSSSAKPAAPPPSSPRVRTPTPAAPPKDSSSAEVPPRPSAVVRDPGF